MPIESFMRSSARVQRVAGFAAYFTRDEVGVPTALLHSLKHHHVLHQRILLLTIKTATVPHAAAGSRLAFQELGPGIARAALTFGFLDEPDVPQALALLPPDWRMDPMQVSYVLGRQLLVPAAHPGMARWRETLFDAMIRLAGSAMEYCRLPPGRVIELGSQVEI